MAMLKDPIAKVKAKGKDRERPKDISGRKEPKVPAIKGDPFKGLTPAEQGCWGEFINEAPWLAQADRAVLAVACRLRHKFVVNKATVNDMMRLVTILHRLGCTPTSRGNVFIPSDAPRDSYITPEDFDL